MVKQNKLIWQLAIFSILKKLVWVLLIFATSALAQKENKYIRSGNDNYEEESFKDAEVDYMKALEKNPESLKSQYNLGGALYKQENYEDASKLYNNLATIENDKINNANSYYNLGNTLLKAQKYPESIESYKNALRLDPNDMDAKYNMEYAKKMLKDQQEQEQNQDKDQDQDKKDEEKKEQDKQDQQQQEQQEQEQKEQQQDQQEQEQNQQQQQPQPQQISKQDAERMLEALKNDENKTLEKVKLQRVKGKSKKVEKDW
ncbi:MAG: tetratricopeptide repeat protein [Bacteroidales bacterium]|nr:tetratricopeptide repeat protein [Bacteroidales bacterium]